MSLSIQKGFSWMHQGVQGIGASLMSLVEEKQQKNTIEALDGVRAIACLAVVSFHLNYLIQFWNIKQSLGPLGVALALSGDSGVTLFFVLSGFLLFMPYAKSLLFGDSWPSARQFYLRRALRIIPGYYASLFLLIIFAHPEYLQFDHLKDLGLFLTFFMDATEGTYQKINGPFWSLAVEWQFYLWLPVLALALRIVVQRGSLRRRVIVLTSCLLALIAWGVYSRYEGLVLMQQPDKTILFPRPVINVFLFFLYGCGGVGLHGKFMEDFGIGMLVSFCYILARYSPLEGRFNQTMRRLSPWLWGYGVLMVVFMAMWEANQATHDTWPMLYHFFWQYDWFREIGLSLGYGACVAAVLFSEGGLKRMFSWAPLRWIGLISYSMYIWHLPLLLLFTTYFGPHLQHMSFLKMYAIYWLWFLVAIVPFSLLFFLLVEKPWMKFSAKLKRKNGQPGTVRPAKASG